MSSAAHGAGRVCHSRFVGEGKVVRAADFSAVIIRMEARDDQIPDEIFTMQPGRYDLDPRRGIDCTLTLVFGGEAGEGAQQGEFVLQFRYGSKSEGPPAEIADLVRRAIELTDPWLASDVARTHRPDGGKSTS